MIPCAPILGIQLGERLFELGVHEHLVAMPHRIREMREQGAILVVTERPGDKRRWGIAKPDMPYVLFLKECLP